MHPTYKGVTLFLLTRIFLLLKSDHILVILLEMQLNPAVKMRPHPVVHPISAVLNERSYIYKEVQPPGKPSCLKPHQAHQYKLSMRYYKTLRFLHRQCLE